MKRTIDTEKVAAALAQKCAQYAARVSANDDVTRSQRRRLIELRIIFGMVAVRNAKRVSK